MDQDEGQAGLDLFQEPEGYYQAEKEPTYAEHVLLSGERLRLRMVGFNPLWGHHLWNAGRTLADYLEQHASNLVENRSVLELGAGAGLPSLVAALKGASKIVMTDYPDAELVQNMQYNIDSICTDNSGMDITAQGYRWGDSTQSLFGEDGPLRFDTLILGDLLFNHSEHIKLIKSVRESMSNAPDSVALVFFTPYRPWLLDKDLAFFDLARASGFQVKKTFEKVLDKVMFDKDPGDELLRRTVYGYELRWPAE